MAKKIFPADLNSIVEARIHPAIGIARVGNSDEFFIGPELSGPTAPPPGGYKDSKGRLKRQAAQFRVYGYDANGRVVRELTSALAEITWTVHVANKKGAWYDFDAALDLPEASSLKSARRNPQVQGTDRSKLVIDPGPRSVCGPNQKSQPFDTGQFFDRKVYLGELLTDAEGRLQFLGGLGKSDTPFPGFTLTTFANNSGWYDDTSDGPVMATVRIGTRMIPVDPAWVVTGPPNYSPDLVTPQTMYDVIADALNKPLLSLPKKPSFTRDILPLLSQFCQAQWVNYGFFVQFGWRAPNEFMRPDFLQKLAAAPETPGKVDVFQELRRQVFYSFRSPTATVFEPLKWPPMYGDAFGSFDSPTTPRDGFTVTKTLYAYLEKWMLGNFVADYEPHATAPASLAAVPLADQPATLDRAALHWCMGGPFHPGCEMTWPMRHASMYRGPFRIRQIPDGWSPQSGDYGDFLTQAIILSTAGPLSASGPGDISRWMAVPWQSDTASCRAGYPNTEFPSDPYIPTFWPSRVPNNVLSSENYKIVRDKNAPLDKRIAAFNDRPFWLRSLDFNKGYIDQITHMVHHFGDLGVIEQKPGIADSPEFPPVMYVESQVDSPAPAQAPPVKKSMASARFRGLAHAQTEDAQTGTA